MFKWFLALFVQPLRVEHEHRFTACWTDAHAEVDEADPIRHTAFVLYSCRCGQVTAFPEFNYHLTTPRYKAKVLEALRENGMTLVLTTEPPENVETRVSPPTPPEAQ